MLQNPTFWVAVSFVMFFAIVWKAGTFSKALKTLDERSAKIEKDLVDAAQLRADAEALLKEYEAKKRAVEKEAQAIIEAAKAEAKQLADETEAKLSDFVKRRSAAAEAKIVQAEAQAYAEVRSAASNAALKAAEIVLKGSITGKKAEESLSLGLKEVSSRLN
jgi:F-type H+-transporting ATPase subunit b